MKWMLAFTASLKHQLAKSLGHLKTLIYILHSNSWWHTIFNSESIGKFLSFIEVNIILYTFVEFLDIIHQTTIYLKTMSQRLDSCPHPQAKAYSVGLDR
jgi:hypothetical protein